MKNKTKLLLSFLLIFIVLFPTISIIISSKYKKITNIKFLLNKKNNNITNSFDFIFTNNKNISNIKFFCSTNTNKIFYEEDFSEYIYIKKSKFKLYYKDKVFNIGIGKPETPTPEGVGYIYEKRNKIIFRYKNGILKGQPIQFYTDENGFKHPMPYSKMRALGIKINGEKKYSIHSTTETNSIGKQKSNGCIRMKIEDMLELFNLVEVGTLVIIDN